MLDSKYIRENIKIISKLIQSKGVDIDFQKWELLDKNYRLELQRLENLNYERNQHSKQISVLKNNGKNIDQILKEVKNTTEDIKHQEIKVQLIESELKQLNLMIPNPPHTSVPFGKGEKNNLTIKTWGSPRNFDFKPKDHLELGESLSLFDFKRGAKIAGRGFPVFTGLGSKLERALINFFLDIHTNKNGFTEITPPIIVNRSAMIGTGQIPKMEDDMYNIDHQKNFFLIPTAEVPLTNLHANETLTEKQLPISYVGYTPCFRKEAGAWGKDTRGLQRLHQFNKVEMVKFVKPEHSYQTLEELLNYAESLVQTLELPYRVLELCTGDLSFGAAKCYDIEVYAPANKTWLEVSSISNFETFQSRRANIRYKEKGVLKFLHTLNGSGLATPRIMISLLENNQNEDGSINIPQVLQPYLGGLDKLKL